MLLMSDTIQKRYVIKFNFILLPIALFYHLYDISSKTFRSLGLLAPLITLNDPHTHFADTRPLCSVSD